MKTTWLILIAALIIGAFTRSYQLIERFSYAHDTDLSAWIVKDMIIDGHPRLIGQLTSSPGIFIGPLFYYQLVPLYLISGMEPAATLFYPLFVGLFSIFSLYYITAKIWGRTPAALAALLYAASFLISQAERSMVPTTPVYLWTIWFIYSLHLLLVGRRRGLVLTAVLFSLVWHIQLVLGLLIPLSAGAVLISRKYSPKNFIWPAVLGLILMSPLVLFEVKHNFSQTRSLFGTFSSADERIRAAVEKAVHVAGIAVKNANGVCGDRPASIPPPIVPGFILIGFLGIALAVPRLRITAAIFLTWMAMLTAFFIRHPINISEYYLSGFTVLWILMAALVLARPGRLGWVLVIVGGSVNPPLFFTSTPDQEGYLARKNLVDFIAADARQQGYPCVAVSFMTSPGYDLGYRFLFYRKNLHVNRPDSLAPVYTIVFPHYRANRLDFTFQALGLVLPDYERYTDEAVKVSCSGQNSNITDPMFGFTN